MRQLMRISILFLAAAGLLAVRASAQELAVVVNKSNPVDNLSLTQLRKMLLGEQGQWASGKQVMVLLRTPGAAEREIAIQTVCGMTENDFTQHYLHASFNGGTSAAPKALGTAALLRQLVTTLPGALGIIAASDVNDSVKVVKLEGHAPGDPAYKLKK